MGGVEIERADTGESLTCSDLPTLGGEMLVRSLAIVAELIEFCRLRDRCVRTEAGEGAVAAGGSEGDLKRLAGNPSAVVVVLSVVLGEAIGIERKDWAKECGESAQQRFGKSECLQAVLISRGGWVQFCSFVVYVLHLSSKVTRARYMPN